MKDWSTLNKELIKGWIVEAPLVNSQGINTTTGPVPVQIQALNEGSQGTSVLALAAIAIGTIAVGGLIWWYWGKDTQKGLGTEGDIGSKELKEGIVSKGKGIVSGMDIETPLETETEEVVPPKDLEISKPIEETTSSPSSPSPNEHLIARIPEEPFQVSYQGRRYEYTPSSEAKTGYTPVRELFQEGTPAPAQRPPLLRLETNISEISCEDVGNGEIIGSYETRFWETEVSKKLDAMWVNLTEFDKCVASVADEDSPRKIAEAREHIKRLAMLDEAYVDVPINLSEFQAAIINSAVTFKDCSEVVSTCAAQNMTIAAEICSFLTT